MSILSGACHNERLEFLGDAVVNLAMSQVLFERHPNDDEGMLSARRARCCRRSPEPAGRAPRAGRFAAPRRGEPPGGRRRIPPGIGVRGGRRSALSRSWLRTTRDCWSSWPPGARPHRARRQPQEPEERLQEHTQRTTAAGPPTASSTQVDRPREAVPIESEVDGTCWGAGGAVPTHRRNGGGAQALDALQTGGAGRGSSERPRMNAPARSWAFGLRVQVVRRTDVVEFGRNQRGRRPERVGQEQSRDGFAGRLASRPRLRSRKSEDVIWAGRIAARPRMADVTLVLDNADGLLPVDYSVLDWAGGSTAPQKRLPPQPPARSVAGSGRPARRRQSPDNAFLFIARGWSTRRCRCGRRTAPAVRGGRRRQASRTPAAESRGAAHRVRGEPRPGPGHPRRAPAAGASLAPRPSSRPARVCGTQLAAALLVSAHARWHEAAGALAAAAAQRDTATGRRTGSRPRSGAPRNRPQPSPRS